MKELFYKGIIRLIIVLGVLGSMYLILEPITSSNDLIPLSYNNVCSAFKTTNNSDTAYHCMYELHGSRLHIVMDKRTFNSLETEVHKFERAHLDNRHFFIQLSNNNPIIVYKPYADRD